MIRIRNNFDANDLFASRVESQTCSWSFIGLLKCKRCNGFLVSVPPFRGTSLSVSNLIFFLLIQWIIDGTWALTEDQITTSVLIVKNRKKLFFSINFAWFICSNIFSHLFNWSIFFWIIKDRSKWWYHKFTPLLNFRCDKFKSFFDRRHSQQHFRLTKTILTTLLCSKAKSRIWA